ncbi:uncharacterized protein XM38_025380 [Halomicronema hongdechloris C2206]|uniref:Uncharacterized protein n=1 Tax=Halomicronema hongdechloris C2206 TaxID=1641165 RepID=A0A1Z3HMT6_9CYAN|nr:hypothetical protein [Halomicronema hongdechloris]ASC71586.1 uncharacterized protein XM38_025380 [Halomicronema hongdechloris C2206]
MGLRNRLAALLLGAGLGSIVSLPGLAQPAPTARYAQGEAVDLALIIEEWKQKHPEIPVFACVCDQQQCDHTPRWPFRTYSRYQFTVALGPFNASYTESRGFNCFDIQTGQAPDAQTDMGSDDASDTDTGQLPTVAVLDQGRRLQIRHQGQMISADVTGWNLQLFQALDCSGPRIVPQKEVTARRVISEPAIDPASGNIAVPVLLEDCVETQQSAVFVVDPQGGAYGLYRVQLPGEQSLPHEFASYPFASITGLHYWDSTLFVRQGDAAGNRALVVFEPGRTPAGTYGGCLLLETIEGSGRLCPRQ